MALSATCLWASLDELKPWLRLGAADVQHDVVLEQLANSVTEEMERLTARVFVTRAISETFDSTETVRAERGLGASRRCAVRRFVLRGYPVTTSPLTTFTIDGVAVNTDDYILNTRTGDVTLLRTYASEDGVGDVVIAYTAGYARASLPATVLQLGVEMLAFRYQDWGAGANAAQSVQFGPVQYVPRSAWPYHVKDALEQLRLEIRGPVFA